MDYIIEGQHKLNGEVAVCGSKNCALPLLAATVLTDKEVVLHNCPDIFDVQNMLSLLESLGKKTQRQGETVIVGGEVDTTQISREKAVLLRGSGLLLGGLVAKRGSAFLPQTGPLEMLMLSALRLILEAPLETEVMSFKSPATFTW